MPREHPLARVERGLKVAARVRLDLIEEVDADVRSLQAELERRGHSPARARRAALQQLLPGAEALDQLEERHAPLPRRWARGAGWLDHTVRLGVGAVATVAGAAAFRIAASGSTGGMALLLWSQVLLTALLAANLAGAGARLWIHGDLRPVERRVLWARSRAGSARLLRGAPWKPVRRPGNGRRHRHARGSGRRTDRLVRRRDYPPVVHLRVRNPRRVCGRVARAAVGRGAKAPSRVTHVHLT